MSGSQGYTQSGGPQSMGLDNSGRSAAAYGGNMAPNNTFKPPSSGPAAWGGLPGYNINPPPPPKMTAAEMRAKIAQLEMTIRLMEVDRANVARERLALADQVAAANRMRDEALGSWRTCDKERKRLELEVERLSLQAKAQEAQP